MSKIGQTMKLSVELINHGDVVMVYSPEMQCEFPVRPQDVDETLKCLVCEWTRILRADEKLQDEETPPYTLLIGGETVEKAHSWKHFDTEKAREDYWISRCSKEYAWLPFNGTFLANTDSNVKRVRIGSVIHS